MGLFAVRTVNLREIAVGFSSPAKVDSRYKRLKRFFASFEMDTDQIAVFIIKLFFNDSKPFYLTIDRTNWFWGKRKINILMLAVAYEGIAIPVLWDVFSKAGNASAAEHQAILQRFINLFGKSRIAGVLADREFASADLFKWFNDHHIPFYIRIKEDSIVRIGNKKLCSAKKIFHAIPSKTHQVYPMDIKIFSQPVNLAGSRSDKGELMIVATNQPAKQAVAIYLRRWEIETLFACLKNKGFRLEETRLVHPQRIAKLIALLAIGLCWAHKVGEWLCQKKSIPWNTYQGVRRPQYSYFRYGLDWLQEVIIGPLKNTLTQWHLCLQQLQFANNLQLIEPSS